MKKNIYFYILWPNSLVHYDEILSIIDNQFNIIEIIEIDWGNKFEYNLKRLYGASLPNTANKLKSIGIGSFKMFIFYDNFEIFNHRRTTSGIDLVNAHVFDIKTLLRTVCGSNQIHGSNTFEETMRDLSIIDSTIDEPKISCLVDSYIDHNLANDNKNKNEIISIFGKSIHFISSEYSIEEVNGKKMKLILKNENINNLKDDLYILNLRKTKLGYTFNNACKMKVSFIVVNSNSTKKSKTILRKSNGVYEIIIRANNKITFFIKKIKSRIKFIYQKYYKTIIFYKIKKKEVIKILGEDFNIQNISNIDKSSWKRGTVLLKGLKENKKVFIKVNNIYKTAFNEYKIYQILENSRLFGNELLKMHGFCNMRKYDIITMEYVEYETLEDNPRLSKKDLQKFAESLLKTLKKYQKLNIQHRDIRPANIFITPNKNYILFDYGFSISNNEEILTNEKKYDNIRKKLGDKYRICEEYWSDAYSVLEICREIDPYFLINNLNLWYEYNLLMQEEIRFGK